MLTLCWAVVLLDCHGGPELVDFYEIATARRLIVGTQPCGGGDLSDCPLYGDPSFIVIGEVPQGVYEACTSWIPPPLGPGEVAYLAVTTVDQAGNRDTQECF